MFIQFGPETLEGVLLFLQTALACVAQVVGSDAIDPSQQAAFTSKTSQMLNHTNQNLLRRIAGVFGVPEHTQRQAHRPYFGFAPQAAPVPRGCLPAPVARVVPTKYPSAIS